MLDEGGGGDDWAVGELGDDGLLFVLADGGGGGGGVDVCCRLAPVGDEAFDEDESDDLDDEASLALKIFK